MCPLRFIPLFFSATLAGYFAWRTFRSSLSNVDDFMVSGDSIDVTSKRKQQDFSFKKVILDGFGAFVDMTSGRYSWKILQLLNGNEKAKAVSSEELKPQKCSSPPM